MVISGVGAHAREGDAELSFPAMFVKIFEVGGEGEGLFGVTFSVDGHTNEPVVRVNPLSALTPGFLRKIVAEASKGGGSSSPEINPTGSKK